MNSVRMCGISDPHFPHRFDAGAPAGTSGITFYHECPGVPQPCCPHKLAGGPLVCDNERPHDPDAPGGHTYAASWASDDHTRTEEAAEGRQS